jgi:Cytochrome P460
MRNKKIPTNLIALAFLTFSVALALAAQDKYAVSVPTQLEFSDPASGQADNTASPIFGVTIPPGYRDWKLISVTHEEGDFNQLRAQLGNDIAINAYREGKLPFPDGAIIVALHWKREASDDDNKVFGRVQAFVAGSPVNLQVMVKDSKQYAATGGWGFGDFRDGKPSDAALHEKCFACHLPAKAYDYVYTHYAP